MEIKDELTTNLSDDNEELSYHNLIENVFGTEENLNKTVDTVSSFIKSYEENKDKKVLKHWLLDEFAKSKDKWEAKKDMENDAEEVLETIKSGYSEKARLLEYLKNGKRKENFISDSIDISVKGMNSDYIGEYLSDLDNSISLANDSLLSVIVNKSGTVNLNPNLHGFIAEQQHVNTFNIDAAAKQSSLRAEMRESVGLNSVDIYIKDGDKIIKRYQSKYCATPEETKRAFGNEYRGQTKLVPSDQVDKIEKSVDSISEGSIKSKPLSYKESIELRNKIQIQKEVREYSWKDENKYTITKNLGKQFLTNAGLSVLLHGGRIFGERILNKVLGRKNNPVSNDINAFFESSINSTKDIGIQTAITGAVVVAARNGWIKILKNTPAGRIASIVYVTLENLKILYKVGKGELTLAEGLDAMGNVTTICVSSLICMKAGASIGAAIGTIFGPVGTVIGSVAGGIIGGIAGNKIGSKIYEGAKKLITKAKDFVIKTYSAVKNFVKEKIFGTLNAIFA